MADLLAFARCLAAEFSNGKQAAAAPKDFAHIRVFFRPLPWEFFGALGFYSEQAYDYDLWQPYRQGVHRLVDAGDRIRVENYGLREPMEFAGAGHTPQLLRQLTPAAIAPRAGCAMEFWPEGEGYRGQIEPGGRCLVPRDGQLTYLESDVEMTATTWVSWDRGLHPETGQQVWGSTHGPLRFEKRTSFAEEVLLP